MLDKISANISFHVLNGFMCQNVARGNVLLVGRSINLILHILSHVSPFRCELFIGKRASIPPSKFMFR